MGNPAARVGDMHTCPMQTPGVPPIPHVGGPILPPGAPQVLIGNMPSAVIGNMCTCVGPPDVIAMGSTSVIICGRFASRLSDSTAHGGMISVGLPTVLIGGPASTSSFKVSGTKKSLWQRLLAFLGIKTKTDSNIKFGNIIIQPDPNDPGYQGKVLGDLIMLNNTPSGKKLLKSLNDSGGAIIKPGNSKIEGNCCWTSKDPPEIEYNPDRNSIGPQPWNTRPPAIGLAHEMIHADHAANGSLSDGNAQNDNKPNPANPGTPPQEEIEELKTVGIPPNDTEPYSENKFRSEWFTPQPQRQWY